MPGLAGVDELARFMVWMLFGPGDMPGSDTIYCL